MSLAKERTAVGNQKGFIGAAYAFLVVMIGTTLPTPLYPIYADAFGLSPLMITII